MEDNLGKVVYSIAGRDSGSLFIVLENINDEYYILSDGEKRKVENPKKKNAKHIKFTDVCFKELRTKLINHDKISNAEIRDFLKSIDLVDIRSK